MPTKEEIREDCVYLEYTVVDQDFARAGEASSNLKKRLKEMGISSRSIRRVSIALYEGEINMVIHAHGGRILAWIYPDHIRLSLQDVGPGIEDVSRAMQVGYTTASKQAMALGFGAGMGLPNMKKNTDEMEIETVVGQGTTVNMVVRFE